MKIKHKLMMLALGAATFQFGLGNFGCGGEGGFRNIARFLGDLIGTTIVLTGVD